MISATRSSPALAATPFPLATMVTRGLPVVILTVAVAIRLMVPIDANIDWLMTNCRRFLGGARLYQDIVETNPPMAIFIYLPAAIVERWTGWAAESVFTAMVLAAGTASAYGFCALVRPVVEGRAYPVMRAAVLFALVLAPLSAFGEREHVALILLMPCLGLAARRMAGHDTDWKIECLAGLAAGIAPMIKPYFAFGIAAPYAAAAFLRRDIKQLFAPEALIAAFALAVYTALIARFLPAYPREVMPLLLELYRPMGLPWAERLLSPKIITWTVSLLALALAIRRRMAEPVTATLVAASAGFVVALLIQGRDWPYHAYPAAALMIMAVPAAILPAVTSGDPMQRVPALAAAMAAFAHLSYLTAFGYGGGGVVAPIRAAVSSPTIMSISFDLTPGHPITTETGGTWAGTYSSRWITVNASFLLTHTHDPKRIARLEQWMAYDRSVANRDLAKRPDIVLVGLGPFDWPGWIAEDPVTRQMMSNYVPLASDPLTEQQRKRFEGVEAFIRRDLVHK